MKTGFYLQEIDMLFYNLLIGVVIDRLLTGSSLAFTDISGSNTQWDGIKIRQAGASRKGFLQPCEWRETQVSSVNSKQYRYWTRSCAV